MARPLRLEFPGALFHLTSRGNRRQTIYEDAQDRRSFLAILACVVKRFGWRVHAYCLMGNHYHLIVETPACGLSRGMRHLNGVYAQRFNERHDRVGHLFQGRFHSVLVDREAYLLQLARYVMLNPVRAGLVKHPAEWEWSSYGAMTGRCERPELLTTRWLLAQFGLDRAQASRRFEQFVAEGAGVNPWTALRGGMLLGERAVPESVLADAIASASAEVPRRERITQRPALTLLLGARGPRRRAPAAIRSACHDHRYTLAEVGHHLGLHYATVSRIVNGVTWSDRRPVAVPAGASKAGSGRATTRPSVSSPSSAGPPRASPPRPLPAGHRR